jgi:5'-3' exonuclease
MMLEEGGVTHLGVATDHVIESFRNDMWPGYKTGEGIDPDLYRQFPILEQGLAAMGITVWPMVEFEADDALGAAAAVASADERVTQVLICTPDKDLAQCVEGERVVMLDRRHGTITSIPDYLGLVGDTADGYPGLKGWGAKSTGTVLASYGHIEDIPDDASTWNVKVRGAAKLAEVLSEQRDDALLFREIATVRRDAPVSSVDDMAWRGPTDDLPEMCRLLDRPDWVDKVDRLAQRSG